MKYTVFFEQVNRTNFQVNADSKEQAQKEATRLYKKYFEQPSGTVQENWLLESDGEDK